MSRQCRSARLAVSLRLALAGASGLLGACGSTGFRAFGQESSSGVAASPGTGAGGADSDTASRGSGTGAGSRGSPDDVTGRLKQSTSIGVPSEPFFGEGSSCQSASVAGRGEDTPGRRYFYVTGNGTSDGLDVKSGESLDEVCVFLAGNQTSFTLSVERGARVKSFHVVQRGNLSRATATVERGGDLASARVDQSGNQAFASVEFGDPSKDACAVVRLRQRGGALGVKCVR